MSSGQDVPEAGAVSTPVPRRPTAASLVTYSAVTWNPHRIHYDREYVRTLGHADLVVHGALVADWVLQWVAQTYSSAGPVRRFAYRMRAPAYVDGSYLVGGEPHHPRDPAVTALDVWVRDDSGATILEGEVVCSSGAGGLQTGGESVAAGPHEHGEPA